MEPTLFHNFYYIAIFLVMQNADKDCKFSYLIITVSWSGLKPLDPEKKLYNFFTTVNI